MKTRILCLYNQAVAFKKLFMPQKYPLRKEEGIFVVAGVGFEPTTFWL